MTQLLLAKAHFPVTVLGHGRRAGIWTQGCTIRCAGCLSTDTWAPDPLTAVPVSAVLGWLASLPAPVDGVTVSGGEPFQQPEALGELLTGIRAWLAASRPSTRPPADVLVYSGYTIGRLQRSAASRALLDLCDAVIAGPYIRARNHGQRWRGSANQRVVPLTPLGRERYCTSESGEERPRIQVAVGSGTIMMIGIPRDDDMETLTSRLAAAGVHTGQVSWRT